MKKRILVIYETAGGGHLSNARAIEAACKQKYPDSEIVLMHVSVAAKSQRVAALYDGYNRLLKFDPRIVKYGYTILNSINAEKLVLPLMPKVTRNLKDAIDAIKPDVIVSVFGMVNYAIWDVLKNLGWAHHVPFLIFVTDMTTSFLRSWVHPEADMMIAMLPETKQQLVAYGMPEDRIRVLNGLPVNPGFIKPPMPKPDARRELGMALDRFTVLVTMGGVANKNTVRFTKDLANSGLPLQIIVVCGRNASLKRKMDRIATHSRAPIKVLGFTDKMPLLMDASDLAISKPGPGTIAELVHKEIPMLIDDIFDPMPQERGNLDFVLSKGIGLSITKDDSVPDMVRALMNDPLRYEKFRAAARAIKNESAVFDLVDIIMSFVPKAKLTPPAGSPLSR